LPEKKCWIKALNEKLKSNVGQLLSKLKLSEHVSKSNQLSPFFQIGQLHVNRAYKAQTLSLTRRPINERGLQRSTQFMLWAYPTVNSFAQPLRDG